MARQLRKVAGNNSEIDREKLEALICIKEVGIVSKFPDLATNLIIDDFQSEDPILHTRGKFRLIYYVESLLRGKIQELKLFFDKVVMNFGHSEKLGPILKALFNAADKSFQLWMVKSIRGLIYPLPANAAKKAEKIHLIYHYIAYSGRENLDEILCLISGISFLKESYPPLKNAFFLWCARNNVTDWSCCKKAINYYLKDGQLQNTLMQALAEKITLSIELSVDVQVLNYLERMLFKGKKEDQCWALECLKIHIYSVDFLGSRAFIELVGKIAESSELKLKIKMHDFLLELIKRMPILNLSWLQDLLIIVMGDEESFLYREFNKISQSPILLAFKFFMENTVSLDTPTRLELIAQFQQSNYLKIKDDGSKTLYDFFVATIFYAESNELNLILQELEFFNSHSLFGVEHGCKLLESCLAKANTEELKKLKAMVWDFLEQHLSDCARKSSLTDDEALAVLNLLHSYFQHQIDNDEFLPMAIMIADIMDARQFNDNELLKTADQALSLCATKMSDKELGAAKVFINTWISNEPRETLLILGFAYCYLQRTLEHQRSLLDYLEDHYARIPEVFLEKFVALLFLCENEQLQSVKNILEMPLLWDESSFENNDVMLYALHVAIINYMITNYSTGIVQRVQGLNAILCSKLICPDPQLRECVTQLLLIQVMHGNFDSDFQSPLDLDGTLEEQLVSLFRANYCRLTTTVPIGQKRVREAKRAFTSVESERDEDADTLNKRSKIQEIDTPPPSLGRS